MIWVLWAGLAFGHGDEPVVRLATWSSEFDAVLVVPHSHPGEEVEGRLLLADHTTSAPVDAGRIDLKLHGPADVELTVPAPDHPGRWPLRLAMPLLGDYEGALTVITSTKSDVLGVPPLRITEPTPKEGEGIDWAFAALGGLCGAIGGLLIGLALGIGGRRLRALVPVAVLVSAIVSERVLAHGGDEHGAPAAPAAPGGDLTMPLDSQFLLALRTAKAGVHPFEERVRALGTTVAPPGRHAEVHAPVTGVVSLAEELVPGATVVAGQPLASIVETLGGADRSSVVDARTSSQVRLAQAKSALAIALRDQQQAASLGDLLSGKERLARDQAVSVAREEVRQSQSAASGLSGARSTVTLRSPIAGRVAALLARPGDVVVPGDVLYHVVGEGGLWVEARLPQTLAGRLQSGAVATIESDAAPGVPMGAVVLDPGLEADPATGTLVVTLALDAAYPGLVPGMSVTASIVSGSPRQALTVPDAAVVDSGGESIVFVKTAPETFAVRPVRLGARAAEQREILDGVAAGERVVVQGGYSLRSLAGR